MTRPLYMLMLVLAVSTTAGAVLAQEVFQQVRQRTGWVGRPLMVQYVYSNIDEPQPPTLPEVEGLTFTLQPRSSTSHVSILNGRQTSRRETTFPVAVVATRPGTFTLPAFEISAQGQTWSTEPVELTFRPADDTTLLRANAAVAADHSWLGDVVPAVLQVKVRPFRHQALPGGKLSMADTWRLIDQGTADWGPYADTIEHYRNSRTMPVTSTLAGPDNAVDWYVYRIPAMLRPDRAGSIDMGEVQVAMEYPVELGQNRDPFAGLLGRGGLRIVQARPVTAHPESVFVDVRTPPEANQPADWTGAVGRFEFDVQATPEAVDVGEPLTLRMTVTDVSERLADLDTLAAPALHRVEDLAADFKIPEERPGGIVSGRTKTFTQSIRPMHDGIDVIPPVPFSYFDPDTAGYETVLSPPIPITVHAGRTLTSTDLPGLPMPIDTTDDSLTAVHGGLLANIRDRDALLERPAALPMAWWLAVLAVPPLLFAGAATTRRLQSSDTRDPARNRARRAQSRARTLLQQAGTNPAGITDALRQLVMDRLDLPEGQASGELVLELGRIDSAAAADLDALLGRLEAMTFGGSVAVVEEDVRSDARSLVKRIVEVTG